MYAIIPQQIPQDKRAEVNEKILFAINSGKDLIPAESIYNCYTGVGGLHNLRQSDFASYHEYARAKKEFELGQFFTPHEICWEMVDVLSPTSSEMVLDMCCGMGNFFNHLPNRHNTYGFDIDGKAVAVARYLYPDAHIEKCDIQQYRPEQRFDIIIGNPPFNLKFDFRLSQEYYMDKLVGFARKKRLGDLLVDAGVISQDQLVKALQVQKTEKQGERLGVVLIDLGFTDEKQIVEALKAQLKIQSIDLSTLRIPEEIIRLLDEAVLRKYNLIPFKFNEKNPNLLCVAMSDPLDIRAMDDVSIITGCQVERFAATPSDIAAAIDRYYGNAEALRVAEQYTREKQEQAKARAALDPGSGNDENNVQQAPIVKLLGQIIEQAVHKRASDIHIEPMENQVRIRFRVDGVLHEAMRHDISLHAALIARIKIVSGLDISEKRRPQDGRATSIVDRQEYDIRVSVLPTVYGEKVVMRLAQKKALTLDKRDLGFPEEELKKFDHILSHPNGLILVTGPTGSGKSTTLYTALNELNVEGVNIITVEDPVEANLNGVNQVQVNEKAGLTFSSALRSILRQDPDIIMIGEIRDQETAEIAVKASITGHLVVSTLHTNSSANTITRLADMGVENYLIADSVVGVIAQRLVRRVCPACGIVREATAGEKKILGIKDPARRINVRTPGHKECVRCGGTGYYGRIGIYEIMPVTADLRQAINRGENADVLEEIALTHGMKTLRMSAIDYALRGITTVEEVQRVAYDDEED